MGSETSSVAMDPAQLVSLGKVAGIGGIALGVVVLLVRRLIGTVQGVPAKDRARTVNLIALGCFAIGALGMAAWAVSSFSGGQSVSTAGDP
jgi:hypothetical protein